MDSAAARRNFAERLEIESEIARRLKTLGGIFLEAMPDNALQRRWNCAIRLSQIGRIFFENRAGAVRQPLHGSARTLRLLNHACNLRQHGVLGRSEGCLAVSPADLPGVLQRLGPGRLIVARKL